MRHGLSGLWSNADVVPQLKLAVVLSGQPQGLKLVFEQLNLEAVRQGVGRSQQNRNPRTQEYLRQRNREIDKHLASV